MHMLVLYGSLEGQTEKIAKRIAQIIQGKGQQAVTLSVDNLPSDFLKSNTQL